MTQRNPYHADSIAPFRTDAEFDDPRCPLIRERNRAVLCEQEARQSRLRRCAAAVHAPTTPAGASHGGRR